MIALDSPVHHVNRVGRCLTACAHVAYAERGTIVGDKVLRQLAAEVSGLLDCLDGLALTSPEERQRLHMAAIERLAAELPLPDGVPCSDEAL